jgi:WD40 repeat protein
VLPDGRIFSWAWDNTLRLWDSRSGKCLAVLKGHSSVVRDALVLSDGRILSWSADNTVRLWDSLGGTIAVHSIHDGIHLFPEFRVVYQGKAKIQSHCLWDKKTRSGLLRLFGEKSETGYQWHCDSACTAQQLLPDGRAILTQSNGQVCFLHIYRGNHPISIEELEKIELGDGWKLSAQ